MEIRTLEAGERDAWLDLLDGWELPDGWTGRDFFGRFIEDDPTWSDENVWVAEEDGQLVSTVQIFPRELRVLDHAVPTGGIGSVYTRESHRRQGVAGQLLDRATVAMRDRGMELSLLFAIRFDFYARHGWSSFKNQRAWMRRNQASRGEVPRRESPRNDELEISHFDLDRDLAELGVLQAEYSRRRSGTVVRDDALWEASFELAGNPDEELIVARQRGELVAHLRLTRMMGKLVVTELSRLDDPEPLAELMDQQLRPRERDVLCASDQRSEELREALLLPCFDDLPLTVSLERRGISAQVVDDPTNMLQCLDAEALAARLDVSVHSEETPSEFLRRVLPPESFVFWPADRF
jgi:GNAT superfamily N-acetyltransferase